MTVSAAPQPNALPPLEFGRDPRESQLSGEKLAQLAEACKPVNPASASTSDSVTPVLTIEDFEAALAHSASRGRLTVFKFYAPWCRTCTSIKKNYDAMAGGVMPKTMRYKMQAATNFAEVADFHEIEYTAARPLCAMCNITSMPLVHVYAPTAAGGGPPHSQLQLSSKLAKSSFISFCNRLAETVDEVLLPEAAAEAAGAAVESRVSRGEGGGGMSMSMGLAEPEEAPEGTRDLEVDLEAAIAPPT
jgi:thiol-disulfide isomerase/thioredoxin